MSLKPGELPGYKLQNDQIWPELVDAIRDSGIATITIFENDPMLVLYSEIEDEEAWTRFWSTEVYERWAKLMDRDMMLDDAGSPEASVLREIFHLD